MDKIPSFQKDHNAMDKGLYVTMESNGVTTFDLRFKKPNTEYIDGKAAHTIEHLLATTLRNSPQKDNIIYFGPMGCLTGFYLLTVNLDKSEVLPLLISCIKTSLDLNEIPGNKKSECGNYLYHDLDKAKKELKDYLLVLNELI